MADRPELVVPGMRWGESFLLAEREFLAAGERIDRRPDQPLEEYVAGLLHFSEGSSADESVPSTLWWLVDGDVYVGRVSVRHRLTGWMERFGGHVGFEVRPSYRRRGYGTMALRLVLPRAFELGHDRVLVTCAASNVGSRRVIEACGGVLESEVVEPAGGEVMCRYLFQAPASGGCSVQH